MSKKELGKPTLWFVLLGAFCSIWMRHQTSTATLYKFLVIISYSYLFAVLSLVDLSILPLCTCTSDPVFLSNSPRP